jgi:hypothetical protein
VVKVLTLRERVRDEVWGEAVAEGEAKGVAKRDAQLFSQVDELESKGIDPAEILRLLKSGLVALPTANNTKK